ncbi:MAG: ATP-binding cassette domain-containing protein [Desulfobacterales bacterium]
MTQPSILETRDVSLTLGEKLILDHLSLSFWPGHVHAVVGPNGAGKSTLANTIMGRAGYTDFSGDISFEGNSLKGLTIDQRARLGITMGWQEPARYEGLSVESFIRAGAGDKFRDHSSKALEQVGLKPAEYLSRAVDRTLSGGERKRIELASILTMQPKLVLMDEPDSGIDVEALERIFDAIGHLKQQGSTVLLSTHSPTVLKRADHAFLICCGQLMEKGPVEKIIEYFGEKCIPCDHQNQPEEKKHAK